MRIQTLRNCVLGAVTFVLILANHSVAGSTQRALPNPVLYFTGAEYFEKDGKSFTRYTFDVDNKGSYPAELFVAAPSLAPCGANTSASRTWVDIFNMSGKRLNGFCALEKPSNLDKIWFALESDAIPPSWIYIEMTDRQTNTKYKSNLADTTL